MAVYPAKILKSGPQGVNRAREAQILMVIFLAGIEGDK